MANCLLQTERFLYRCGVSAPETLEVKGAPEREDHSSAKEKNNTTEYQVAQTPP